MNQKAIFSRRLLKIAVFTLLVFWALVVLFPFYWMLLTSVKSYGSYNAEYVPKFFTLSPTFENYVQAFSAVPLAKYFLNTSHWCLSRTTHCSYLWQSLLVGQELVKHGSSWCVSDGKNIDVWND